MMTRTSETDMANSDEPADIDTNNAAWAICKTYHKILKASPGAAHTQTRHNLRCPVRSSLVHWRIGVAKQIAVILQLKLVKNINP